MSIDHDTLLKQLRWRYATKKFDPNQKIDEQTWATLEEALILSPSSYGLQPWKFFVIKDPEIRARLRTVSYEQAQIEDASHLVVLAVKSVVNQQDSRRLVQAISQTRQVPIEALTGYETMINNTLARQTPEAIRTWMSNQVYIALGNLLTSAALLGVDACPMEGFQPEEYDRILDLNALGYHSVVVATLGYRASEDNYGKLAKVRFPKAELIQYF